MAIKEIRNMTGLSQKDFSEKYGIPKRTIENWEAGVTVPPEYVVILLEFKVKTERGIDMDYKEKEISKLPVVEMGGPCEPVTLQKKKCNCTDEMQDIENAIHILKIVQYCWADQIPNDGQVISDYDAIGQAIKCVEEYNKE